MTGLAFLLFSVPLPPEGIAPAACETGEATPEQRERLKDFDFLIGDFWVTGHMWLGTQWSPPRPNTPPSRWNGRYGLGGTAIIDEWFNVDPGFEEQKGSGVNVRMKRDDGVWEMVWLAQPSFSAQHLVATINDKGEPVMTQVHPERKGFVATFTRLGPDQWMRVHHALDAEGNPLPPIMLKATRIPCIEG